MTRPPPAAKTGRKPRSRMAPPGHRRARARAGPRLGRRGVRRRGRGRAPRRRPPPQPAPAAVGRGPQGPGSSTTTAASPATAATCRASPTGARRLIGVGVAAVYFQVTTGRMPWPARRPRPSARSRSHDEAQTSSSRRTSRPSAAARSCPTGRPARRRANLAEGGELFRLNCASCHNFAGRGGALSSGKYAPSLTEASDRRRSTPRCCPARRTCRSSATTSSPREQKQDIINYVQTLKDRAGPGRLRHRPARPGARGPGDLGRRDRRCLIFADRSGSGGSHEQPGQPTQPGRRRTGLRPGRLRR